MGIMNVLVQPALPAKTAKMVRRRMANDVFLSFFLSGLKVSGASSAHQYAFLKRVCTKCDG